MGLGVNFHCEPANVTMNPVFQIIRPRGSLFRTMGLIAASLLTLHIVFSASAATAQVLRRGNGTEPATLDPHRAAGVPESNILRDLFEGLVTEGPAGELLPGAAERWEVSADGTIYTFYLRSEGRWSNGEPVTAEDFRFSLRRGVAPATASDYSFILSPIRNAEDITSGRIAEPEALGVRVIDERTLEITLKAPTPYFLALLAHTMAYPVHRASLEKHGVRFTRPGNLVGNGAYRLVEWRPQDRVRLIRNENYRAAATVSIPEVHYYPTEDQNTELRRYRAGELDMTATVPIDQLDWVKQNLPGDYKVAPYLGTYYYVLNVAKPPFKNNPNLRWALSLAINRQILTDKVTKGGQIPAFGWIPPGVQNYQPQKMDQAEMDQEQRERLARGMYRAAGYLPNNPLEVEILYNTSEGHKMIAVAIAAMWRKALGVRTRLVNREWKVYLNSRKQGDFMIARAGWIGDYNDANTFAELMLSDSGINDAGYNNPDYDVSVRKAALTTDLKERVRLLESAERQLLADHPIIPIYHYVSQSLVRPEVKGWQSNILDHHASQHLRLDEP